MNDDQQIPQDQIVLQEQLLGAGFNQAEISKAFDWLDELAWRQGLLKKDSNLQLASTRVFTDQESLYLDLNTRGMLLDLEQAGILDPVSRELVIERAMALESIDIDINDIKWISLLVLMSQPGRETAFSVMQDLVYDEVPDLLH